MRADVADGSDSLIGLPNHSPRIGATNPGSPVNEQIGLHNSWYGQ